MISLKEEVKEIVELVALVPDEQKAMCFEVLLKDALTRRHTPPKPTLPPAVPVSTQGARTPAPSDAAGQATSIDPPTPGVQPKVNSGSDIALSDLHVKTRKFLEKGELTLDHLNELFYKEGDQFQSLSVDLKVTKMSEGTIRIALLQALQNALSTGDFETTVEAVREECKARKTYDQNNFTSHLKTSAELFDFGAYSKEVVNLRLSEMGKTTLATLVKQLS